MAGDTLAILALRRLRQDDNKFKTSLNYIVQGQAGN